MKVVKINENGATHVVPKYSVNGPYQRTLCGYQRANFLIVYQDLVAAPPTCGWCAESLDELVRYAELSAKLVEA